ncbi:MAG: branched-chain amino acid ABC transporter permease [Acidimicrobiales bacterium]
MSSPAQAVPALVGRGSSFRVTRGSSVWAAVAALVVVVVLAYLPYIAYAGVTDTLVNFLVLLTLGMMWNLLAGYAGLVSVGQQGFIGLGSYTVLVLAQQGVEPFVAIPAAAVVAAVIALPTSWLVFRLSGGYFAIGTWVVAEVFELIVIRFHSLGGGTGAALPGLSGLDPTLLGAYTYWAALVVGVLAVGGGYALLRSRLGLSLTAVRDNETAARSAGTRVQHARRVVYLVAAAGCGAVGAILVISQLNVEPASAFSVQWSADMIFVALIGGLGSIEGPIVGAILFTVLQQTMAQDGVWYLIMLGAVAVIVAVWVRRGLWGLFAERTGARLFPVGYRLEQETGGRRRDLLRPPWARDRSPGVG